jgi:hypothetical protein
MWITKYHMCHQYAFLYEVIMFPKIEYIYFTYWLNTQSIHLKQQRITQGTKFTTTVYCMSFKQAISTEKCQCRHNKWNALIVKYRHENDSSNWNNPIHNSNLKKMIMKLPPSKIWIVNHFILLNIRISIIKHSTFITDTL